MEYALLYTFSTIPQTLGSAIAILSAFVLYRFATLDPLIAKDIDQLKVRFIANGGDGADIERLESEGEIQQILDLCKSQGERSMPIGAFKRLKHGIRRRASITWAVTGAVYSTGVAMLLSIIVLPTAHLFSSNRLLVYLTLAAGVVIFCVCMGTYWLVISAVLGLRKFRADAE